MVCIDELVVMTSRMKTLIGIIIFIPLFCFSQSNCDTIGMEQIINIQLKYADKWFDRPFVLFNSSIPYNAERDEFKLDSVYTKYPCAKGLNWNQFDLNSKYCTIESDTTTNKEYSLFISTPVFNEDNTKCKFVINTHFSEWGGQGRLCFYEKRGKKWKFVRSTLIWVS
jgi:hypothetical protein